jgi:hypothetical protein
MDKFLLSTSNDIWLDRLLRNSREFKLVSNLLTRENILYINQVPECEVIFNHEYGKSVQTLQRKTVQTLQRKSSPRLSYLASFGIYLPTFAAQQTE